MIKIGDKILTFEKVVIGDIPTLIFIFSLSKKRKVEVYHDLEEGTFSYIDNQDGTRFPMIVPNDTKEKIENFIENIVNNLTESGKL